MSKGIIIFARDNSSISYSDIACVAAGFVRKNLKGFDELCLITDQSTVDTNGKKINKLFDRVIVQENIERENPRLFKDTIESNTVDDFKNLDRKNVFHLTPYEETLVIDADYFIMSNVLDNVWGSSSDFLINCKYRDIAGRHDTDVHYIDDFTIPMYWATVFYFKKTDYTQHLFTMIEHISENYQYYASLYSCKGGMFRNDYAFSIALHILNSNMSGNIPSLPIEYLNNSFDLDDIFRVNSSNDIIMFCAAREDTRTSILGRFKNADVHIMNKFAILRHIKDFDKVLKV